MYFKAEYEPYYKALSEGADSINTAVEGLKDSIVDVSNQFSSIELLIEEMDGDYSLYLNEGLSEILNDINNLKSVVYNDLPKASSSMSSLGGQLIELKPKDEEYEKEELELEQQEKNKPFRQYEYDEAGKRVETEESQKRYNNWLNNINELKESIEALKEICSELQKGCDTDINIIDEFNSKLVDLRLKLVAIASASGGKTIKDVDTMTPEEKKQYLEEVLDELTKKYRNYKNAYEFYAKENLESSCTKEEISYFVGIYDELIGSSDGCPSAESILKSNNLVTRGNAILSIIEKLAMEKYGKDGKDLLEIVYDYSNGSSWTDSGMAEVYQNRINNDIQLTDAANYYDDIEELFWTRATYGSPEEKENALKSFFVVSDMLQESGEKFDLYYKKTLGCAMMVKGIRGLNDSIEFDCMSKSRKFEEYIPNKDLLYENGILDISNEKSYTLDEQKMISYLLENYSYEDAKKFIDMKADSINRRNGRAQANEYYDSLHNGSNEGIDAIIDHISVGGTGFADGLSTFADGLIDLVAPDKVMSKDDYANIYFLDSLEKSDDPYDKSLLLDYRITNKIGQYTIPTIVSATTGGSLGTALFITSDVSHAVNESQMASYRATMDFSSMLIEQEKVGASFINVAKDYAIEDIPNDIFGAVLGSIANVNPILGAAVDMAFDEVWKNNVI